MASQQQPGRMTPEEYLAFEETAQEKHEYLNGYVYAMSGASLAHARIGGNVFATLRAALRGHPCEVFNSDVKLHIGASGLFTYPDTTVVCGRPVFESERQGVLTNPTVIVEVLSPSTEAYDRGDKFTHYAKIPSLQAYVLVSQRSMQVEYFLRDGADGSRWVLTKAEGPEAVLALDAIGVAIPLAAIYERVDLPPDPPLRAVQEPAAQGWAEAI